MCNALRITNCSSATHDSRDIVSCDTLRVFMSDSFPTYVFYYRLISGPNLLCFDFTTFSSPDRLKFGTYSIE